MLALMKTKWRDESILARARRIACGLLFASENGEIAEITKMAAEVSEM